MKRTKTPTIIAVTALVVAVLAATPIGQAAGKSLLAKSSIGTTQLKRNAVTSAKIRKNAVSAAKIRKNAVTSLKVKNGSLLAVDFKAGQLPAGPQGPKGDKGDSGVAKLTVTNRQGPWTNVPAGATVSADAHCQPGEVVTGGGPAGVVPGMIPLSSYPLETPTPLSWRVRVTNTNASPGSFSVVVVCAAA